MISLPVFLCRTGFPFNIASLTVMSIASKMMESTFLRSGVNTCVTIPFTKLCFGSKRNRTDIVIMSMECSLGSLPTSLTRVLSGVAT